MLQKHVCRNRAWKGEVRCQVAGKRNESRDWEPWRMGTLKGFRIATLHHEQVNADDVKKPMMFLMPYMQYLWSMCRSMQQLAVHLCDA